MPLPHPHGYSRDSFDANFEELRRKLPERPALAAAYRISRSAWRREHGQEPYPSYLRFPNGHLTPRTPDSIPHRKASGNFVAVDIRTGEEISPHFARRKAAHDWIGDHYERTLGIRRPTIDQIRGRNGRVLGVRKNSQ